MIYQMLVTVWNNGKESTSVHQVVITYDDKEAADAAYAILKREEYDTSYDQREVIKLYED